MTNRSHTSKVRSDIHKYIEFSAASLGRSNLQEKALASCKPNLEAAQKRRTDTKLHLAVVGEFNSGKSTLINALLRDDLLKMDVNVSTATPTYLQYGDRLDIAIRVYGQSEAFSFTEKFSHLWSSKFSSEPENNIVDHNLRQCLAGATSLEEIASKIDKVTIFHPSPLLADGVVIIDTPGVNVQNERRHQVTQRAVTQSDILMVTIPGPFPVPHTLISFLTGPLHPFLHRALFVATQMDKIQPFERAKVIEVILKSNSTREGLSDGHKKCVLRR